MRRAALTVCGIALMWSLAAAQGGPAPGWTLVGHMVASDVRGAYAVVATDMNKDGRADLVSVAFGPELVWFENPSWTKHVIASGVRGVISAAAADVDNDGIPELAVASGFATVPAKSVGNITIYTRGPNVNDPWIGKEIDRVPVSHRLQFINARGDGRRLLVNAPLAGPKGNLPDYKDRNFVYSYDPAADWKREVVTDAEDGVMHGIAVSDWDGKGRDALLTASFLGVHVHRFENGRWTRTRLVEGNPAPWPQNGAGEVAVVRAKNARLLATMEPFHGNAEPRADNEVVVYTGSGDQWGGRAVIDKGLNYGHVLLPVDLDNDGSDELVGGYIGKPNGINVYRRSATGAWSKTVLESNTMPGSGCAIADFNNDKRMDFACTGGTSLKWYENKQQ